MWTTFTEKFKLSLKLCRKKKKWKINQIKYESSPSSNPPSIKSV